jgi:hypothetical protein
MDSDRDLIYKGLLRDFEGFSREVGGWASEKGTELDGLLWKLAGMLVGDEIQTRT